MEVKHKKNACVILEMAEKLVYSVVDQVALIWN